MAKILTFIIISILVSLYYFPFGFTFLPEFINTKNLLAAIGIPLFVYDYLGNGGIHIPKKYLIAIGIALIYSIVGHIIVDYHQTTDLSYANYIVSFFVWSFGAYAVCSIIEKISGDINIKKLTFYLAFACVMQCILAIVIDRNIDFQLLVNRYIEQEQDFLMEVDRLYGIGASLDNAGIRFCTVLLLIAGVLVTEEEVRQNRQQLVFLLLAFFIISIIGNMISRTTTVGAALGIIYLVFFSGILSLIIKSSAFKFNGIFILILSIVTITTIYFYNTDKEFYRQIRFAFEGFFNWVETGVWRTGSTDKLNREMWVWPETTKGWLIGTGLFDDWVYGTDIGYCRHILYNGLIGFSIFCFLFIYHPLVFIKEYKAYWPMFLCFMALSFIVWVKVSTDIYQVYALLYAIGFLQIRSSQYKLHIS